MEAVGDGQLGQNVEPEVVGVEAEPARETVGQLADSGAAAGLLNTGLQVGASLGLSALAAIAAIVTRNHRAGSRLAAA